MENKKPVTLGDKITYYGVIGSFIIGLITFKAMENIAESIWLFPFVLFLRIFSVITITILGWLTFGYIAQKIDPVK